MFSESRESSRPKFSLDLGLEQVYGRDSVTWRTRYVPVMQSRYVRFLAAVLGFSISSLCLAACGSSGASSSTTVTTSPASKAIVTAWFAAQKAFHDAALTSNPNNPELAAAMIPPQLDRARTNLAAFASRGYERGALPTTAVRRCEPSVETGQKWCPVLTMTRSRSTRRQGNLRQACWGDRRMS